VTPLNGYSGSILLTCSNLPVAMAYSFAPSTVTADGSNTPQVAELTITTRYDSAAVDSRGGRNATALAATGVLPSFLVMLVIARRRKKLAGPLQFLAILVLLFGGFAVTGCTTTNDKTPKGAYTISVKAQGTSVKTLNLQVTVQ